MSAALGDSVDKDDKERYQLKFNLFYFIFRTNRYVTAAHIYGELILNRVIASKKDSVFRINQNAYTQMEQHSNYADTTFFLLK